MKQINCLFCEIVDRKKSAYIVAENEAVIAILDLAPVSDGHTLLITKQHFANVSELNVDSWKKLSPILKTVVNKLQATFQPQGFNFLTNMGEVAYQSVFHFHLHIIPKYAREQGFIWTTKSVLKLSLEQVATKLQNSPQEKN